MIDAATFAERARAIAWLLCDVDGVLTDGRLYFSSRGEALKVFNVRDGLGLKLAQRAGLKVGLLSARRTAPLARRAEDLGLDAIVLGREDKGRAFTEFLAAQRLTAAQVAYVGDDLPDLAVLVRAGLSFCPADAVVEVRSVADRVLSSRGGDGVAREAIELLLGARGVWEAMVARFSHPDGEH